VASLLLLLQLAQLFYFFTYGELVATAAAQLFCYFISCSVTLGRARLLLLLLLAQLFSLLEKLFLCGYGLTFKEAVMCSMQ
jgi:hypothetical protein